nr:MAG TPA: hypothetical protein [Caudoviricetes sp.]
MREKFKLKNPLKTIFCKHEWKRINSVKDSRGYIIMKMCSKCGRTKIYKV